MKFDKEDLGDNKVKYTVTVDPTKLKSHHEAAVKRLGKNAKVAGFRQGHIPLEVLERAVDPMTVANSEINDSINETIMDLIEDESLWVLGQPEVSITKYVPAQTLEFSAEIRTIPPVKLGDAKKLKVKKPEVKVDDKQVDEVLERLRTGDAKRKEVNRAAKNGDEVVIDFTGVQDDKEFAGGSAKDYPLTLGSGAFIPGFEDAIVGHKAGEKFDAPVTFPKEYGAKNLAGKKAVFHITLKKVNELTLPELNDDFARTISPEFQTLDALKDDIRKSLEREEESEQKEKYRSELIDALAAKSKATIPDELVESEQKDMRKRFEQNLAYRGMKLNDYLKQDGRTEEQWEKEDLHEAAEKQIRSALVLRQFIKDNDIKVSDEEVKARQNEMVSHYNDPKLREHFASAQQARAIREELLTDKAYTKLAELNESK